MTRRQSTGQVATWLLENRVTPPRHRDSLVRRPRVLKALNAARRSPIIVLDAPPGFGKSAVLAQWLGGLPETKARTAWLTIDAEDDLETAIRYMAFAFHVSGLDLSRTHLLDDAVALPRQRARALQSLLACVEKSRAEWTLVIDDLDAMSPQVVTAFFAPLIRFTPGVLTMVLATCNSKELELSDAVSRGLVSTIGTRELRFDRNEVRAVWGRSVTASQICRVERLSAGWPALVQLMREHGATPHFGPHSVSARARVATTHFFEARVLRRLDSQTLGLVLRLALLPHFTADFVASSWNARGVDTSMHSLMTLGVICALTEKDPSKLTVHPLFREYLAERFVATDAESAAQFRYQAAREYLRRGDQVEAVQVALATADNELIGDIIEACNPLVTWMTHGLSRLRQLVRLVPNAIARSRPRVGYACVICWVKEGKLKDAQHLYDALEDLVSWDELENNETQPVGFIERVICQSSLAIYRGTPVSSELVARLDRLVNHSRELAPILRSLAGSLRSHVLQHAGRFSEAKNAVRESIRFADEACSPYAAFFMYCDLGMISGIEGSSADAFRFFQEGHNACEATVQADERLSFLRDALKLEIEHEIDPTDTATTARLRNICMRLPRLEGWLDVFAAAYRTYSEKLYLAGDLPAALATLTVGIEHLREQDSTAIAIILMAQRVLLLTSAGRTAEAVAEMEHLTAGQRDGFPSSLHSWRELEAFIEARVVLDLAHRTTNSLPLLEEHILRAQRTGNVRSELRFRRLRLAFPDGASGAVPREQNAERTSELEASSGFRRAALVAGWLTGTRLSPPAVLMSEDANTIHPEFFTAREVSVLRKLDGGLTDKSIAIELGITAHGVRYHLKRIYAKLNARDRMEARLKAGRLGIVASAI